MAFEYESKTPQDVLVYTDDPVFHKHTVIIDALAADVTCGDVINPTTGAAYVAPMVISAPLHYKTRKKAASEVLLLVIAAVCSILLV